MAAEVSVANFGANVCFPAGRQLAVHHDAGDPDALLTPRLANGVEARTEQQLTEHLLDAALRNAGTVVLGL